MKQLFTALLLSAISLGQQSEHQEYDGKYVTIVKVRQIYGAWFVDAVDKKLAYSFKCETDKAGCSAPLVGDEYLVEGVWTSSHHVYDDDCEEYELLDTDTNNPNAVEVCLDDVRSK